MTASIDAEPGDLTDRSPLRIQRQRVKGWRLPVGAKIVDRSSRWGNPFAVRFDKKRAVDFHDAHQVYAHRTGEHLAWFERRIDAHRYVVALYREWLDESPLREQLELLRGHDLACPCPPDLPCHADVLLEVANA